MKNLNITFRFTNGFVQSFDYSTNLKVKDFIDNFDYADSVVNEFYNNVVNVEDPIYIYLLGLETSFDEIKLDEIEVSIDDVQSVVICK